MSWPLKLDNTSPASASGYLEVRSGIYQEYALQHMRPEQIDPVDIAEYLGVIRKYF
jgi:hypothetical protein